MNEADLKVKFLKWILTERLRYEYATITVKKKKAVKKSTQSARRTKRRSTFELKGISKTIVLVVIAVLLIGGAGFYFMTMKGGAGNPLSRIIKKPLNPNCEYKDPDLCKFFNNYKDLPSFTMVSNSKYEGVAMESKFESQGQNKTHIVTSESGKESMNIITIGDTTYTKDYTDNKWFKQTYKPDPNATPTPANDLKDTFNDKKQMEDKTEYKALGKEACGSMMCFKYQVITPGNQDSTDYIWFDDNDYLLRKQSTTTKDGNTSESTFSYDSVSITEPSPVKEGEPGMGTVRSSAPGMSEEDKKAMQDALKSMQNSGSSNYTPPADNSTPPADDSSSSSPDNSGY